jgi:hypothetical protein
MMDQLVASRGPRIFFGCFFSTFTGHMNRIRGYHSVNAKEPGYEQGELPTAYYYATIDTKYLKHKYSPLRGGGDFQSRFSLELDRYQSKGIGSLRTALQ